MKEYWKKFKEFRKDPKKKSISLLIIYGIFFIFVFIYIKSGNTANTQVNTNINQNINESEKKENIVTSYEYQYEIIKDNNKIAIVGTYLDNEETFTINNNDYFIKDYYIYSNINNEKIIEFPINRLSYNSISQLLNDKDYNSKTEYKDGQIKYEYIISNKEYSEYYKEENNTEGNITILINKKDYIEKIEIDLSKYYNIDNYKVFVNYNNINNISNIEKNESH